MGRIGTIFRASPAFLLGMIALLTPRSGCALEIAPFDTFDQSPLVQIYGLPAPGSATVLQRGQRRATLAFDLASNYAVSRTSREQILLDGETARATFSAAAGVPGGYELGLALPAVDQGGGFLDGFIDGWHRFFHLPDGGRPQAPKGRLLYRYDREGGRSLAYSRAGGGVGDLRLEAGKQLYRDEQGAMALRVALKLPTGDPAALTGSGSTDLALWFSGQRDFSGRWSVFGALGGLAKTDGSTLHDQQRTLVGYGSLGAGFSPLSWLALKMQLSSHTPFYRNSDLPELGAISTMLVVGGTIAAGSATSVDIGVSEDVSVLTSPDVSFHLALTRRF